MSKALTPLFFLFVFVEIISKPVSALDVEFVTVKVGDPLQTQRKVDDLKALHQSYKSKKYKDCIDLATQAESKHSEVKDWIMLKSLECGREYFKVSSAHYSSLVQKVNQLWNSPESLLWGASQSLLRAELIESTLVLIDHEIKKSPKKAWTNVAQLLNATKWMTAVQLAKMYRLAGDLSFAQKNYESALSYYRRSLNKEENSTVQARIESLAKTLLLTNQTSESDLVRRERSLVISEAEEKALAEIKQQVTKKNHEDVVKYSIQFIKNYPGSVQAPEVSRFVLNTYLSLAGQSTGLKSDVLSLMKKASGTYLLEWAQTASQREYFRDAMEMAEAAASDLQHQTLSTQALLLAAQSAYNAELFSKSREFFLKLTTAHAGTKAAAEAWFRLGLIDFREKKYESAVNNLSQVLKHKHFEDFELASQHWLWRSYQKLSQKEQADKMATELILKYPLSYYGLRARAESTNEEHKLFFKNESKTDSEWKFSLTSTEAKSWRRFLTLKTAGWIDESQMELEFLTEPESATGQVVFAYIWSQAGNYHRSSEILYRAFSKAPHLMTPESIRIGYPRPYYNEIKKEAKRYGISTELILALMKQESSFRTDVKSPAGAMGLMQLMPATAREVASDMRIKIENLSDDLADPAKNIRIGTQYLHRRLRAFNGHVPLALGAYNAGIGNIRNWQNQRKDLADVFKRESSLPEDELWFDELPWTETTGYIKSILRNYLIYKVLDQSEIKLTNPVWSQAS